MAPSVRKCEICREWIDEERLSVLTHTILCAKHAAEIEKYGGEFHSVATIKSTAKAGSLKPNPTDVSASLVRNDRGIEQLRLDYETQQDAK